jgi:uncharacterized protein YceK
MRRVYIIFILVCSISGCASVNYRSQDYKPLQSGVYPSVRSDIGMISDLNSKDYDPLLTGAEPLIFILATADIPIAMAVDTILLPCDLFQGISNMNRVTELKNKYLPSYKLIRDTGKNENHHAYFKLVSPSGDTIRLSRYWIDKDEEGYQTNQSLNNIIKQNHIMISSQKEAIEFDTFIFMLLNGEIVNQQWEYQVNQMKHSWQIQLVDKATKKVRLGFERELIFDDKNILQKVRSK